MRALTYPFQLSRFAAAPLSRLAVAALLAAVVSVMLVPAAFAATGDGSGSYVFVPIRLTAHDIEDPWPDNYDEPRAYYGGQVFEATIINKGVIEGSAIPRATFTGSHMKYDLWERDNGWTNNVLLGTTYISSASTQLGEERSEFFQMNEWWRNYNYELRYKVCRSGDAVCLQ